MKKTQRKQTKKVNNTPNNNEQSLSDFGLEPPKIYRNSSGKIISDYKDIDLKKRLPYHGEIGFFKEVDHDQTL